MSQVLRRWIGIAAVSTFCLFLLSGCGGPAVPAEVTVELPDGTEVRATQGSGVLSLADTEWDFFAMATNAQGAPFLRLRFGSQGELAAFDNNTIASEIFGTTILFDGLRHNTTQPGLEYAAGTFGAETSDASGFTFQGVLTAYAAGFEAANATATATGEFDPDNPDLIRGTFTISSKVTILDIPEGNQEFDLTYEGRRVTGE